MRTSSASRSEREDATANCAITLASVAFLLVGDGIIVFKTTNRVDLEIELA